MADGVTRQPAVAELTKEVDALNAKGRPSHATSRDSKQPKPAKKDKDTKSKTLVNGICYIHAKYGVQATKCALPEKCLHRNQIAPKSEKSQ